jgi:hypothetical protein
MLVVDMDMGIGSGAVVKMAASQLIKRALPAAVKAVGVPSRFERGLLRRWRTRSGRLG